MKHVGITAAFLAVFVGGFWAGQIPVVHAQDPQVAVGEWKIEIQTPPCDGQKNIQVIYPAESGAPMAIECDLMPVNAR